MSARARATAHRSLSLARIAAALGALSERDRLILSLRLVEGLSALEAAGALRMSAREVERRTASAMRVLGREIGLASSVERAA